MNIAEVFSTEKRVRILEHIMFTSDTLYVSDVARDTNTSKGLVSKYLNQLVMENVLEEEGKGFKVRNGAEAKALKVMLSLGRIELGDIRNLEVIDSIGVYGSAVKGENNMESDIDIWILHNHASPEDLAYVSKTLGKLGDVNLLYLTREKVDAMRDEDPVFYYSLVFGSIVLHGEGIDGI